MEEVAPRFLAAIVGTGSEVRVTLGLFAVVIALCIFFVGLWLRGEFRGRS